MLRKLLLALALLFVGVIIAAFWWRIDGNQSPPPSEPEPVALPDPNAFDILVQAAEAILDKEAVADAVTGRENPTTGEFEDLSIWEKRQVVEANRKALALLRQALRHPFVYPDIHHAITEGEMRFGDFRMLARLLGLEAEVHREARRFGAAMATCLDCIALGQMVGKDSVLIGALTGIAISGIGRRELPEMIGQLRPGELDWAIRRLESQRGRQMDMIAVIRREREFGFRHLESLFAEDNWRLELARMDQMEDAMDFESMFMEWDDYPLRKRLQMRVRSWRFHKGRMVRAYDDMMARMEAAMGEPYAEDHWPKADPRLPAVVNDSLTGTFRRVWFSFLADQTSQEMLLAALALEDWRSKTGAFPEELDELKDQRPEVIPRDPFTDGSPLLYRREGEGYLLYSVGPDGRDDGGQPVEREDGSSSIRFVPQPDLEGDLVAWINLLRPRTNE